MRKTNEETTKEPMVNLAVILVQGKIYKALNSAKGQVTRKYPLAKESGFLLPEKEAKEFIRGIAGSDKSRSAPAATDLLKNWEVLIPQMSGVSQETMNRKKVNMTKVSKAFYRMHSILKDEKRTPAEKVVEIIDIIEALEEGGDE
jgi:hypothetical protein